MTVHTLKVVPPYLDALLDGTKTFEVRRNDRGFQLGDELELIEWNPNAVPGCRFTGRKLDFKVTYVYAGDPRFGGIESGFVVLGLARA